jgi:hypothetical protein
MGGLPIVNFQLLTEETILFLNGRLETANWSSYSARPAAAPEAHAH